MKRRNRSLRTQILLVAVVPLALLGLAGLGYLSAAQYWMLDRALVEQGQLVANYAAMASEYGLISGDRFSLKEVAKGAMRDNSIIGVTLLDASDKVLVTEGVEPLKDKNKFFIDQRIYFRGTGVAGESLLGRIVVVLDRGPTREAQLRAIAFPIGLMVALLVVAWRISERLGSNIADPVTRIIRAMDRIKEGKLETRVPEKAQNELVQLEVGINLMAESLQFAQKNLIAHVEEATADYVRANAELEAQNKQLEEARKAAESATRAKSVFLANMSHEIRTPLNSILGYMQLIHREESRLPEKIRSHFRSISIAASNLLETVNDVLDFSKIEAGKITQSIETFDLIELLDDVAAQAAHHAQAKGLFLDVVVYSDVPRRVDGDRAHLYQIIANLVTNAVKFTHEGGVVIRASLDDESNGKVNVLFEVEDTGIGIPPEHQTRLFQPFEQIDSSASKIYHGSGLGLAICADLAKLLGGTIQVCSAGDGSGTSFLLTIPLFEVPELPPVPQCRSLAVIDERLSFRQSILSHLLPMGMTATSVSDIGKVAGRSLDVAFLRWKDIATSTREIRAAKAIAKQVIVCSEGDIPETDTLDQDGVVLLPLPLRTEGLRALLWDSLKLSAGEESSLKLQPGTQCCGVRILVVDDNALNRAFLSELLFIYGPQVIQAESGPEALQKLQEQTIDLVLLDLHMPGMDGRETARTIRATGNNVPIIAITANALPETEREIREAGMNDLVTKPVDERRLITTMCRWVGEECEFVEEAHSSETNVVQRELAVLFRTEAPNYDQRLASLDLSDFDAIRETAHYISGGAATCLMGGIAKLARDLELAAISRKPREELAGAVNRLRAALVE